MTPQFITLPSGLRINTAHIKFFFENSKMPGKTVIHTADSDPPTITEDMTASELDALLSPPSSPIVSPVLDLDRLQPGAACQFTCDGVNRHGIISSITSTGVIHILSSGDEYCYDPSIEEAYPYEG